MESRRNTTGNSIRELDICELNSRCSMCDVWASSRLDMVRIPKPFIGIIVWDQVSQNLPFDRWVPFNEVTLVADLHCHLILKVISIEGACTIKDAPFYGTNVLWPIGTPTA